MTTTPPEAPKPAKQDRKARDELIAAIVEEARGKALPGPCAARSQDFLYDENGLPK